MEDSSQSEKGSILLASALQGNETAATALAALYGPETREFAEVFAPFAFGPIGLAASMTYGAATGGTVGAIAEGGGYAAGFAVAQGTAYALLAVGGIAGAPGEAAVLFAGGLGLMVGTGVTKVLGDILTASPSNGNSDLIYGQGDRLKLLVTNGGKAESVAIF